MRRLARHLFTICSAASLLLCIAVCVLWVRSESRQPDSYQREMRLSEETGRHQLLLSHSGVLFLVTHDVTLTPRARVNSALPTGTVTPWTSWWAGKATPRNFPSREYFGLPKAEHPWERLGVYVRGTQAVSRGTPADRIRTVGVPYWLIACLTAAPSTLLLHRLRRTRRAARRRGEGRCPACDYDLRASPERCPECGTIAKAVTT